MVAALSLVDILEEVVPFLRVDTTLVDVGHAALVKLVVDDCVSPGSALDLPSQDLVLWELVAGDVGDEGLRPGGHFPDGEDARPCQLRSPRARRAGR